MEKMLIYTMLLVIVVAAIVWFTVVAPNTVTTTITTSQVIQKAMATDATTAAATTTTASITGSNITLKTPQFLGTDYDKTISFKPAIINGTHGFQVAYKGNGVINGVNFTDNGEVFITNMTGGAVYSRGQGILMAKAGMAPFTFQVIGHYGTDGKLRDIGTTIFNPNAIGTLAFLGNTVAIVKDEIDKTGNAITKFWEIK